MNAEHSNMPLLQVCALDAQLSSMHFLNEMLENRQTGLGWCLQQFQAKYEALMKVSIRFSSHCHSGIWASAVIKRQLVVDFF